MRLYICTVGLVVAPDRNVTGKDRRERAKRQNQSETSEGNGTERVTCRSSNLPSSKGDRVWMTCTCDAVINPPEGDDV